MKCKIYTLNVFLLMPFILLSQINYSVKGTITTTDGYAPTGNVIALNLKDSTFINGASFFDGTFELGNLTEDELLLKFSSLEFDDTYMPVTYQDNDQIDLGNITVASSVNVLDEVVVKSRRPVYTQKPDGTLEVLIENTMLSSSNTVTEILSNSPDVILDNGNIVVLGRGNAIFYLNGKRITNDQLSLIQPSNVKKIEIIRNPSAKYDADGAAVINIVTIRSSADGYQVKLNQNITAGDFFGVKTYSNVGLNYKAGQFSSNAYYTVILGQDKELLHTTRSRDSENVFLESDLTTEWVNKYDNYSFYGVGVQHDYKNGGSISLGYSGFYKDLSGTQLSSNNIVDDLGPSLYESDISIDEKEGNNSLSLNYNKPIDTLGSSLFLGAQYSKFQIGTDNFILEESLIDNVTELRNIKNLLNLDIDIFSGQGDFTKIFRNSNSLEFGVRFSNVENNSDLDFLTRTNGSDYVLDNTLSNSFTYKESVSAGYVSFNSKIGEKISYTLGLRSEYTDYKLILSSQEQDIADNYINFFPNLSANMAITDKFNLNFNYISRINRPAYQALNPVLIYQDTYTSIQGNPELTPEKTHSFELGSKVNKINFKIGYSYTVDPLDAAALRGDTPNSYILKRINLDERHVLFSSVSRTFTTKWWTSTNRVNLTYTDILDSRFNFETVESKPNLYFYSNNKFKVSDLFDLEVLFWFLGNNDYGIYSDKSRYNVTVSLHKTFFKDALRCRFIANDIFHSVVAAGNYNVAETDIYFNRRWSTQFFRLALSYNFGKLKKISYGNRGVGASESDRVN